MIRRCCTVLLLLALLLLPAAQAEAPQETPRPARGYVLVQSAGVSGCCPSPPRRRRATAFRSASATSTAAWSRTFSG